MPFKLLKLPHLVLSIVIENLVLGDIFTLSACSTKLYRIVKSVNVKIRRLTYKVINRNETQVWLYDNKGYKHHVFTLNSVPILEEKENYKFDGKQLPCKWSNFNINYHDESRDQVYHSIAKHIFYVFINNNYIFELNIRHDDECYSDPIPNIPGFTAISIRAEQIQSTKLEELFTKNRNSRSAYVKTSICGELNHDSKIFEMQNMYFENSDSAARAVLSNFKGRCLIFEHIRCYESDIIAFINAWMSNEKYHNLEFLFADFNAGFAFFEQTVYREFESRSMVFDGLRRPNYFEVDTGILGFAKPKWDVSYFVDIERPSDKKLASFFLHPFSFRFIVWK